VTEGPRLASLLRPVRAGNAFEETVERLLTAVRLGVVGPGERFPPEREFANQLGISRITLREALRELQAAGYVESRRGRYGGTFVTTAPPPPSRGEARRIVREQSGGLADALTFRMAVDLGAAQTLAQLVAGELLGEEGGRVRVVLRRRLAEVNSAAPRDYRRLDTLFHLAIAELTGSGLLAAAATDARMRLNDLLNAIPILQHNIDHTAGQHAAIVAAILAGDPEAARMAVTEHLEGTAALLRGFLA
jgi:DNA-binding FadR family transcriptional regulator